MLEKDIPSGQMSVQSSSSPFRTHKSAVSVEQQLVAVPRVVLHGQAEGESIEYEPTRLGRDKQLHLVDRPT